MLLLKRWSMRFYLGFILILALATGGSAITAAFADTPVAQVAVNGAANVTEQGPANVSATAVTLNGNDLHATYTLSIAVNDNTGTGNGWSLTITSTQFDTAGAACQTGGHTLNTGASMITSVVPAVNGSGTYTNPSNSISNTSLGIPAGCPSPGPTAVKFFNAAVGSGMGQFTITPTVSIAIPANSYAGTYSSTVTLAIATGP